MPLHPDDTICFCFHVSLRKIETFCRIEKPHHPSQISDCLSAGTGCGWCVPMLKKIHLRLCPQLQPWWRQSPSPPTPASAGGPTPQAEGSSNDPQTLNPDGTPISDFGFRISHSAPSIENRKSKIENPLPPDPPDAQSYKAARKNYLAERKITPPPGAEL